MKQSLSQGDLMAANEVKYDPVLGTGPQTKVGHKDHKESLFIRTVFEHCPR